MKTPMLLLLLSFSQLLLITILPFASADLVDDTCKKTPYADFCASTLRSDPRSSTADTKTLGLIMVDKVDVNAMSTLAKIEDLLGKSPGPGTKQALTSCEESYKIITSAMVPSSKDSLTKGDYKYAVYYMNSAANDATECEAGFGGSKSPLSDSNDYEHKAASVASAIASTLL
ncbi:cell wall / vacuolar inhibitor of fructosidase 1-like [Rhodamnia argentea]|uniref:Cell wall / vacuolar inhibitor of fructosidase 1-like n=1 Tax=Rhodamnia argentea TaxID=178133 RepID=A0ABM3GY72_9MYRT|nr:cell wall / vacuolar inhibitor of fructosidase 1-like [Rhodamnia argentea]